jgi:hypothetical protein
MMSSSIVPSRSRYLSRNRILAGDSGDVGDFMIQSVERRFGLVNRLPRKGDNHDRDELDRRRTDRYPVPALGDRS